MKDIWPHREKMPRKKMEQELVKYLEETSKLNIQLESSNRNATETTTTLIDLQKQLIESLKTNKDLENERISLQQELKDANKTNRDLETESIALRQKLKETLNSKSQQSERIEMILHNNPYYLSITAPRNVQIGDDNTIVQDEGNTEKLVAELEELTTKLTHAIQTNTQERANAESKIRNYEIMCKEFEDSLNTLKEFKKIDMNATKNPSREKELLEVLTSDRTDQHVITDGIKYLRRCIDENMDITELPLATETAITRIVNKCESLECSTQSFGDILEVDLSAVLSKLQETESDVTVSSKLDRKLCENILVHWMNMSRVNDAKKLLERITSYESKLCTEMVKEYEDESFRPQESLAPQMPSLTLSETSACSADIPSQNTLRGQNLQGLPDVRSRFIHQLEGLEILLQVEGDVKAMSKKIDDIHRKMFKITKL
ncbi:uncharacterized protein LOC128552774 [Mercenaria mercenaria]|uniref:uncharacterized protein LOC128552774 n=1 Tax=Mercenaria mercenaria TaxID=6596 RepID=UPI00234E3FA1|nr:uncharacterized protein LOC128552774 [Mercenaria mercenaria]